MPAKRRPTKAWSHWTPARDMQLRAHYATASWPELMAMLRCSRLSIKCRASALGLKRPRKQHVWTAEQDAHLVQHFATRSAVDMASTWGLKPTVVYRRAKQLGLKKDPNFLSEFAKRTGLPQRGAACGFKKGSVPANKGKKMRPEVYAVAQRTMFRKGQRPHNAKPVGAYRVNSDGYLDRKTHNTGYPPADWEGVHRLVWKEHHGEIPPGHIVCFKPGRRTTDLALITIDALECLTKRQIMARNTLHNLPPQPKSTIQTKAILKRMINQRTKRDEQPEEHR